MLLECIRFIRYRISYNDIAAYERRINAAIRTRSFTNTLVLVTICSLGPKSSSDWSYGLWTRYYLCRYSTCPCYSNRCRRSDSKMPHHKPLCPRHTEASSNADLYVFAIWETALSLLQYVHEVAPVYVWLHRREYVLHRTTISRSQSSKLQKFHQRLITQVNSSWYPSLLPAHATFSFTRPSTASWKVPLHYGWYPCPPRSLTSNIIVRLLCNS